MSGFTSELQSVVGFTPEAFRTFGEKVSEEWIAEALKSTEGFATLRKRKLPVDRALWLVIGMGLFRDRSIVEVAHHLDLALPKGPTGAAVTSSALSQARERLGASPVMRLFEISAEAWGLRAAQERRWRGLSLFGADGTCMPVQDTEANEKAFGRPGSARSTAGYPQVRVAALMALESHVLTAMSVGGYRDGELAVAEDLWKHVPDDSLTILDRGYGSFWLFHTLQAKSTMKNRHWLVRLRKNIACRTVKTLGPNDEIVELTRSKQLRKQHPEAPETLQARRLTLYKNGYRPTTVLTSLMDPAQYPPTELASLYHCRWELELGFDEIKTHMLESEETLRSKTAEGVRQEIAGIGIAYNLVRVEIARVAKQEKLPPTRFSFLHALQLIRGFCLASWATSPGAIPRRLASMERDLRLLILPERRTERRYPRQVKVKISKFKRNQGRKRIPAP